MQELKVFNNSEFGEIRTLEVNGDVWFVGRDVAIVLGYKKPENAIATHVDDEDKTTTLLQGTGSNYKSKSLLVNESGLYSLAFNSKLPNAKIFKKWVTSEVLPSIRKTGLFATDELLNNPDFLIDALQQLKQERAEKLLLQAEIDKNADKVMFAKTVEETEDTIQIGAFAKILKGKGLEVGQNRLFEWLRRENYLCKREGENFNLPTQKAMDLGLFQIKEHVFAHKDLTKSITFTPMLTVKGQQYFIKKYLK